MVGEVVVTRSIDDVTPREYAVFIAKCVPLMTRSTLLQNIVVPLAAML